MKSHLIYTFSRLSLVALLICGSGLKARGHDLPQDRHLPPAASANCFAPSSLQFQPFSQTASGWLNTFQHLWSTAGQSVTSLQAAVLNLSPKQTAHAHLSADALAIMAPDPGFAPRPRGVRPQSTINSGRQIEISASKSILPLLVHSPAAGMPPRPRVNRLHQTDFDLALFLSQLDQWQCQISQALFDHDALQQTIADRTQRSYRLLDHTLANLGPLWQSAPNRAALSSPSGPQFVVFDTAAGGHILLTVAQARQWDFIASTAEFSSAQSVAADWLHAAVAPLQQQAFGTLSQHLEFAGNKLLQLSRSISNLAPVNVAARPSSKQWK